MSLADGIAWEREFGTMKKGQGEMQTTEFGANRESNKGRGRFDLFPYEAMEALAIWYEDGAEKYGDRNWEKGLSVKDCINRMCRHAMKAANGWTDEDHLSAVMWNAAASITMMKRNPDGNDHPWQTPKPQEHKFIKKELHIPVVDSPITEGDRLFLVKAIDSGGISDLKDLRDWINRRIE